jgi:hypothetical protein
LRRHTIVRLVLVLSVLTVCSALPVAAQTIRVTGRVVTADSTPVPGARVVLHQVGNQKQGPIDSTRADQRGAFRFGFRPDTSAFYLLSARRAGIEYFSSPVPTKPDRAHSGINIVVYDTSSTAPVDLMARHLVVTRPGDNGARGVLDLIVLRNSGRLTRVAPDPSHPSWSTRLPSGTTGLQLTEGDVSPDAVNRSDDSVIITAPIPPGEKQLALQYQVSPGRTMLELPLDRPRVSLNVLAEETNVGVAGQGLALADSQVIEGRSFRRWAGVAPAPGTIRITLPGTGAFPTWLLPLLVGTLALALVGIGWYLLRRGAGERAGVVADELLDAIAALDSRYLGRQDETPASEWSLYQEQRARLKAELEISLAVETRTRYTSAAE